MARLKGLRDRRGRVFAQQTTAENHTPVGDVSFAARAMVPWVVEDQTADSIDSIDSQPARGKVTHQTGTTRFTIDLRGEPATTDLTFTYTRTVSAVQSQVTATVTVEAPIYTRGWGAGEFYRPEVDGSTDDLVIEPETFSSTAGTRVVLVKAAGLTEADIAAREVGFSGVSEAGVTASWLKNNKAKSGTENDAYYGETDALALSISAAKKLASALLVEFSSPWILFKRGDDFNATYHDATSQATFSDWGISALHPVRVGSYSTGELPIFDGKGIKIDDATNLVAGDYFCTDKNDVGGSVRNILVDNVVVDMSVDTGQDGQMGGDAVGGVFISRHTGIRRFKGISLHSKSSLNSFWGGAGDASSAIHPGKSVSSLVEKVYVDHVGIAHGYYSDNSTSGPHGPSSFGHGFYQPNNCADACWLDILITWPDNLGAQFRGGGIGERITIMGHDGGINPGWGPRDINDVFGLSGSWAGNYTMLNRLWFSAAGFKGLADDNGALGKGIEIAGPEISTVNSGAINSGEARIYDGVTVTVGPMAQATPGGGVWRPYDINTDPGANPGASGTVAVGSNWVASNWNRSTYDDGIYTTDDTTPSASLPAGASSQATRDAATIGAYTDTLLSTTGSDLLTFSDHLVANVDDPWVHAKLLGDYWSDVMGVDVSPTPVADDTVTYRPHPTFQTPKFWGCLTIDWDKQHLPGDATGQTMDLDGHAVRMNFTPKNALADIVFGPGGAVDHVGGHFQTSALTVDAGGNTWNIRRGGGKLTFNGYTGSNLLTLGVRDGRIRTTGNMIGAIDLTAGWAGKFVVHEGAAVTIPSGRTWTLFGYSKVGFGGAAGGSASITNAGTLAFRPSIKLEINGASKVDVIMNNSNEKVTDFHLPKIGTQITGQTSGATGIVRDYYIRGNTSFMLVVDTLSGVFSSGEAVTGEDCEHFTWDTGSRTIGNVNGAPTYVLPTLAEVHTGLNGFASDGSTTTPMRPVGESVASTFTPGGVLHIDVTGVANGDYTLVSADTVTATTFSSVTAAGNSAKDLTVSITGTTVAVNVASGSGGISGGTA